MGVWIQPVSIVNMLQGSESMTTTVLFSCFDMLRGKKIVVKIDWFLQKRISGLEEAMRIRREKRTTAERVTWCFREDDSECSDNIKADANWIHGAIQIQQLPWHYGLDI